MQKNIAVLAVTLALAAPLVPTFAQAAAPMHGPHPMYGSRAGGGRLKKMAAALGLTDAQKSQMKPILMSERRQIKALKANTALTPATRMAQMKAIHQSSNQQMMAILTPAQRAQVRAMR